MGGGDPRVLKESKEQAEVCILSGGLADRGVWVGGEWDLGRVHRGVLG